ncbi:MAG: hypothetical protein AB7V40_01945 [Methyloceanibacter sp.]
MASPKRAWPPDRDSDGETAAAFEAAVAVVKASVARSGEVLSSAKEDLSDHQRWLKAQAAAVESDRERLAKWLQRQRERQEALERREQARARRKAKRQAAIGAVRDRIAGVFFAVRMGISRSIAAVVGGFSAIAAAIASGLGRIGGGLHRATSLTANTLQHAAASSARATGGAVHFVSSGLAAGAARAGTKVQAGAPALGGVAARGLGVLAASKQKVADTIGPRGQESLRLISERAQGLGRAAAGAVAPVLSSAAARAHALAPALSARIAAAGAGAGAHLRDAAQGAKSLLARPETSPDAAGNALSLPQRIGRLDLSQMLIIAGALLLVSGALMLGGGLLLRGSKPVVATASTTEPIAWLFEHDNLALDERAVFTFAATQEGPRITGFAIGGVNMSDQELGAVVSVIKPDHQAKDIQLAMRVIPADEQGGEVKTFERGSPGAIPPQAQFALLFTFPEDGGVAPDQVLEAFGGVMLKVRYDVAGAEKSFIHYLTPSFLEQQLTEIAGEAKGS